VIFPSTSRVSVDLSGIEEISVDNRGLDGVGEVDIPLQELQ